jgi:putative long chain acyl-CoA synthase
MGLLSRLGSKLADRAAASSANVLELARFGRLGQPYSAPYEVVDQGPHHKLRRYATCDAADAPVALFVPPLMVTSQIYDIEEKLSAVIALGAAGVRAYVVDFGAPERESGGLERTLDDHVLAAARCIERVRLLEGRDVHLIGYSQGGMFAYQAAAFVRSKGVASVITFGSPVDLHKSLPAVRSDALGAMMRAVEPAVDAIAERIEALPGALTATGFKLLSTRKEIEQRIEFVRNLHDRGALVRREARRRFLGGEGFVAWPGPAFRAFVDQFVVHNRMLSGGFVLDGRATSLADITCPILAFVGANDELARPASVRAIAKAAPTAQVSFVTLDAGHFGLVVGSRAMTLSWPTVAGWIHHLERGDALPEALRAPLPPGDHEPEGAGFSFAPNVEMFVDAFTDTARQAWRLAGDVAASASDAYEGVRYQEPRLRRLAMMSPDTRTSPALALAERAKEAPAATFFLWRGRAFTNEDADRRVTAVVRGLWSLGVRPGDRVGVVMGARPSCLTMITALSRLGAVAVLAPTDASPAEIRRAFEAVEVRAVATDPDHSALARESTDARVFALGGATERRALADDVVDMERIDPNAVKLPWDLALDAGLARDLCLILLRPNEAGALRVVPVTNHRWALSALGAAAACTLKPDDTVYCCIPLHHPAGVIVSVGSALVGGARLALAERFEVERFWPEVRRYGVTVVFYAGEMLRPLVHAAPTRADRTHPLRLFAGSGMRRDLWEKLHERFGAGLMEFYASTSQRVIMANASGEKAGALGRRLPGSVETSVVRVDLARGEIVRDERGRVVRAGVDEPGVLIARLDADDASEHLVSDAFVPGDRWHATSDVVRIDLDGDCWYVDSLQGFVATRGGVFSSRRIEDALYTLPEVELVAVWSDAGGVRAAYTARDTLSDARITDALATIAAEARPMACVRVASLPLTEGYRPDRRRARDAR